MPKIIQYKHHGAQVYVREDLKGLDRAHNLCYQCRRFIPNHTMTCRLAAHIHSLCRLAHLTLPVWECAVFKEREVQ